MITFEQYISSDTALPLIDVRSPGEYSKGHIPGAINIPLFTDEERAIIGTAYKQVSKEKAMELGLAFVQPKLQSFIDQSIEVAPNRKIVVHCWRGGLRSERFALFLKENGFIVAETIDGGYKSFRKQVVNEFYKNYFLNIIGGYTGSGKTYLLNNLVSYGYQAIDLEAIANHKGSSFGKTNGEQPGSEQFENNLYWIWKDLDLSRPIWLEDESHSIGSVKIPMGLYQKMRLGDVYFLEIPKTIRAKQLVADYAGMKKEFLSNAIQKISKKLGDQNTRIALEHIEQENFYEVAMIALNYYDKSYRRGLEKRDPSTIHKLVRKDTDPEKNAKALIRYIKKIDERRI